MDHQDTVDILNTLIETCNDGERGFRGVAEHVHSDDLKSLFTARANECRQSCADLRAQVLQLGGDPETGGSASGALHRGWTALLGTVSGYSDKSLLEACEKGEDSALERPPRAGALRRVVRLARARRRCRAGRRARLRPHVGPLEREKSTFAPRVHVNGAGPGCDAWRHGLETALHRTPRR
jgi:uncharacterized protein (TIGR02284 family)